MRLVDVLAALGRERLEAIAARHRIAIDPKKRLSVAEQVARGLAQRGPLAIEKWADEVRTVARVLAGAGEGRTREELGGGVIPLLDADLVFPVPGAPGIVA